MSIDLATLPVKRDDTKDTERIAVGPEPATYLSHPKGQTMPPSSYSWEIHSIDVSDLRRAIAKKINKPERNLTGDQIWLALEGLIRNNDPTTKPPL
jgi:hypothetical protein